ncbi:MAG: TonB-dependent receptor plug domain-containing protein [Luteitalea sp.]|nr:TonB-dependent receptor plug domain-containing protein [Luteitalea sp.]
MSTLSTRLLFGIGLALIPLLRVDLAQAQEGTRWHHGVVVDKSGGAVSGARLTVRTAQGAPLQDTATAADGSFALDVLPPGSYWLDVSAYPFENRRGRFDLDGARADPVRVVLGLAPFQSEVTVTAERGTMTDVDRTGPIVTVRTASDFRQRPLATIGNALEGAAGVMVQQSTYGQVSPFLRGLTGYQVLNLVDGVRLNNTTFRSGPNQYLALVDPSQGERIEAMLGPASAQFGSDAMGGAIQVVTPDVHFSTNGGWMTTGAVDLFAASADESRGADGSVFLRGHAGRLTPGAWRSARRGWTRLSSRLAPSVRSERRPDRRLARRSSSGHGLHAVGDLRQGHGASWDRSEPHRVVPTERPRQGPRLQGSVGRPRAAAVRVRSATPAAAVRALRTSGHRPARLVERHVLGERARRRVHTSEPPSDGSSRRRRGGG